MKNTMDATLHFANAYAVVSVEKQRIKSLFISTLFLLWSASVFSDCNKESKYSGSCYKTDCIYYSKTQYEYNEMCDFNYKIALIPSKYKGPDFINNLSLTKPCNFTQLEQIKCAILIGKYEGVLTDQFKADCKFESKPHCLLEIFLMVCWLGLFIKDLFAFKDPKPGSEYARRLVSNYTERNNEQNQAEDRLVALYRDAYVNQINQEQSEQNLENLENPVEQNQEQQNQEQQNQEQQNPVNQSEQSEQSHQEQIYQFADYSSDRSDDSQIELELYGEENTLLNKV